MLWVHNSFLAEAEAAIQRKDATATSVCEGSIQAGKQLSIQLPDKHSGLMTCMALYPAGSSGDTHKADSLIYGHKQVNYK